MSLCINIFTTFNRINHCIKYLISWSENFVRKAQSPQITGQLGRNSAKTEHFHKISTPGDSVELKFDRKKQNIIYLFFRFKVSMKNAASWNELKLLRGFFYTFLSLILA